MGAWGEGKKNAPLNYFMYMSLQHTDSCALAQTEKTEEKLFYMAKFMFTEPPVKSKG